MNIVELLLQYRTNQNSDIFGCIPKIDSENLSVITIELLSWLKLERKREMWLEQGRKTNFKPLKLDMSYPWCKDLESLLHEETVFSDVFMLDKNYVRFKDNISEEYIHEARTIADEKYNPQMIIG